VKMKEDGCQRSGRSFEINEFKISFKRDNKSS
jgi:hypothetical protein